MIYKMIAKLENKKKMLLKSSPNLSNILRGTVSQKYMRCGKPNCHCHKGQPHGPYYYFMQSIGVGNIISIKIPKDLIDTISKQVRNYNNLWKIIEKITRINIKIFQEKKKNIK